MLLPRIFLDELFELALLNHVSFLPPLHSGILKISKLKKGLDWVVPRLRIVLNLTTHGGVTAHYLICPIPGTLLVVGLTHHSMTDHYPVSRKVLKIGVIAVHLESLNQMPHLSNAKVLDSLLPNLRLVWLIKKRFGPLAANLSPPTMHWTKSYPVNLARFEQRVTWVPPKSLQSMTVIGEVLLGHKKSQCAVMYHVGLRIRTTLWRSLSDS